MIIAVTGKGRNAGICASQCFSCSWRGLCLFPTPESLGCQVSAQLSPANVMSVSNQQARLWSGLMALFWETVKPLGNRAWLTGSGPQEWASRAVLAMLSASYLATL